MILTNLLGGIGNQMYQYAIGKHLAILNNTELYINNATPESYKHQHKYRGYSLGQFNIEERINNNLNFRIVKEPIGGIKDIKGVLSQRGDISLIGYWQSYEYFENIHDVLIKEFTLKNGFTGNNIEVEKLIKNTNSVSFHIRRGDKAQPNKLIRFPFYGSEYFEMAKTIIEANDEKIYFIFSDDIEWSKQNIKAKNIYFVEGNYDKPWEDVMLMSMCKHNIIVASSLSWWAAYLNQNPNKIIITPKKWYNDLQYDVKDYNLKGWIEL